MERIIISKDTALRIGRSMIDRSKGEGVTSLALSLVSMHDRETAFLLIHGDGTYELEISGIAYYFNKSADGILSFQS